MQSIEFILEENYPRNKIFGEINAADDDIGDNAVLYYHIVNNREYSYTFCLMLHNLYRVYIFSARNNDLENIECIDQA